MGFESYYAQPYAGADSLVQQRPTPNPDRAPCHVRVHRLDDPDEGGGSAGHSVVQQGVTSGDAAGRIAPEQLLLSGQQQPSEQQQQQQQQPSEQQQQQQQQQQQGQLGGMQRLLWGLPRGDLRRPVEVLVEEAITAALASGDDDEATRAHLLAEANRRLGTAQLPILLPRGALATMRWGAANEAASEHSMHG